MRAARCQRLLHICCICHLSDRGKHKDAIIRFAAVAAFFYTSHSGRTGPTRTVSRTFFPANTADSLGKRNFFRRKPRILYNRKLLQSLFYFFPCFFLHFLTSFLIPSECCGIYALLNALCSYCERFNPAYLTINSTLLQAGFYKEYLDFFDNPCYR